MMPRNAAFLPRRLALVVPTATLIICLAWPVHPEPNYERNDLGDQYLCDWLGNTFPAQEDINRQPPAYKRKRFVSRNIESIFVDLRDGTVFGQGFYEERSGNYNIYRNGDVIGRTYDKQFYLVNQGTGIAADSMYVYRCIGQGNPDGRSEINTNGNPRYPPSVGDRWYGVRRYHRSNGSPAGFPSGYGKEANMLVVNTNKGALSGLAIFGSELFIASPPDNRIYVCNLRDMSLSRSWDFVAGGSPRKMACDDEGYLWVHDSTNQAIHRYATDGEKQSQIITANSGVFFNGLAVDPGEQGDASDDRLLVVDGGNDQNIKIYHHLTTEPVLEKTFGIPGGIYAGIPGRVAPLKFHNPKDVGIDDTGNYIVACAASSQQKTGPYDGVTSGASLEAYHPDGTRVWKLLGLEFVDVADWDPANPSHVYTAESHYIVDYNKPAGQGWRYAGTLNNRKTYPGKTYVCRSAPIVMRRLGNNLFMFGRKGRGVMVWRFDEATAGECMIPYAHICPWSGEDHPHVEPGNAFAWVDADKDGHYDSDEFTSVASFQKNFQGTDTWRVMDDGAIMFMGKWQRAFATVPAGDFNEHGFPTWDILGTVKEDHFSPFTEIWVMEYDEQLDAMFVSGCTESLPNPQGWNLGGGTRLARFDNWRAGNRTPTTGWGENRNGTWGIELPRDPEADREFTKTMTLCGDYIFTCLGSKSKTSDSLRRPIVFIYTKDTGELVGTMQPGGNIGDRAMMDIKGGGLNARRRRNGEYIIFQEDDAYGKIIMYRWCPEGKCAETVNGRAPYQTSTSSGPLKPVLRIGGNELILDNVGCTEPATLRIMDCRGRTVLHSLIRSASRVRVSLRTYPRGMYFVNVRRNTGTLIRRCIVR